MNCPACQHENRDGAKFCEECASPLKRSCGGCGAELRPTAKFCDECGAPVAGRPESGSGSAQGGNGERSAIPDDSTRKVVSIIFADLAGSTALHERLDAESARLFMEGYYRAMRGAVERHGGKVAKLLGDGVMAVFGLPLVAEDDAIRAVRAGVDMQRVFRELAEWHVNLVGKVGLRVAVNTGEVVARDETELIGDPVNVAARLQDQARDGDVVIGESTRRLVSSLITLEPLGSLALKGRAEAVTAYRVVSLEKPASATTAAFVGRDDELARIAKVHRTAVSAPAARMAVLLGSPGLGKSRLIGEFVRRTADEATVISGHCDAAGGTSFAPITRALRRFLGIDDGAGEDALRDAVSEAVSGVDADRSRIVDGITALLAGSPASPEETFFVVRRLFAALATARPVVLVIDDVHWAEPLLLDLVEHLVQWGGGVPLFVLVGARPELRDARSSLATTGTLVADVVTLAGLDAGAAMRLAANVIGATDLPAAVAAKVLASSEGNPLFVGELVRMLVHEGALKREGERWIVGAQLAALEMPPTIHALLASRIERLRPEDRAVLERAAVVGRNFSRSSLAALLPREVTDLDARLESLRRSELIERDTGWFLGEPVLRFHHLLIRDAAYRRLLKGTRAELHGRLADWIETKAAGAAEHDETIGWHLEQSCQLLRELGPLDDRGRALGEKAAGHLAAAGRRALARDDLSLAAGLLGRALPCLEAADASRADLALDWCEALLAAGDVTDASAAIVELDRFTADSPRLRAWHTCFSGQLTALTAPQSLHETAEAVASAAEELGALGDDAGEAKAHAVHAQALARLGRVGACEAALDRALASARKAGDRRRANAVLAGAPVAALWGPSPVTRASGRCLDVVRVLRITQGAPAVEAVALSCQGVLEALRGRTDAAKRMIALSRKMVEELGISHRLYEADVFAGRIDLLEGDAEAAEHRLRGAYDGLRDLGLGIDAARAAALLARALLALGRAEEAEALSHESEILAGDDLQAAIAWRGVRAEALAKRGDHAAAVELAQASVAIAAATDALLDHADARLALAAALRASGRAAEADAEERRAIELWEAKGATLLAERARSSAALGIAPVAQLDATANQTPVTESRRVRDNAATRNVTAFTAAIRARNAAAVADLLADNLAIVHHPTGTTDDKAGLIGDFEGGNAVAGLAIEAVPLAGLGEATGLFRANLRGESYERDDGASFGAFELSFFLVIAVDGEGRRRRQENFGSDHLDHAIVCLYELHAAQLPEGPARVRAAAVARSIRSLLGVNKDWSSLAPDFVSHDHRHTGAGELRGAAALIESFAAMHDLAIDLVYRIDDIVHLDEDALSAIGTNFGTDKLGGGAFERPVCMAWMFRVDGLIHRWDTFEPEDIAAVRAHLDARLPAKRAPLLPVRPRVRPNAATRNIASFAAAFSANSIDASADLYAADVVNVHHATGISFDKDSMVESWRTFGVAANPSCESEALASFGETLCLARQVVRMEGITRDDSVSTGPIEHEMFLVIEVNEQGRRRRNELFTMDHLEDAIARLYELRAETLPEGSDRDRAEATARTVRRLLVEINTDRTRVEPIFGPGVVYQDHRLTGVGKLVGAAVVLESFRALQELTTEMVRRYEGILHLGESSLALLGVNTGRDTRGGGDFERPYAVVWNFQTDGLIASMDVFEPEDAARALARLDELAPREALAPGPERERAAAVARSLAAMDTRGMSVEQLDEVIASAAEGTDRLEERAVGAEILPLSPYDNLASRTWRRLLTNWLTTGWRDGKSQLADDFRHSDRRRMSQVELDRDGFVRFTRELASMPSRKLDARLLATRGERLALLTMRLEVAGDNVGPSEIQHLNVVEVNTDGVPIAHVRLNLDDVVAAYAELDSRFQTGEAAEHPRATATVNRYGVARDNREWEDLAAELHPDMVTTDHRILGWGTLQGRDEFVKTQKTLIDLAPDARYLIDHVRNSERGYLAAAVISGTRDGGRFELPNNGVFEVDQQGLICRCDLYDSEDHARAFARFRSIDGPAESDLPGAFPSTNAATNAMARYWAAVDAGDWDAVRAMLRTDATYEDRRGHAQLSGGVELWLEDERLAAEGLYERTRRTSRVIGVFGKRICVENLLWTAGPDDGKAEVEILAVTEVDEEGRLVRSVDFGPEQRRDAQREALNRWIAIDPDAPVRAATLPDVCEAFDRHDADGSLALFGSEFTLDDHRLAGLGRIDNADAYTESLRVLWDLAPDQTLETGWFFPAYDCRGWITTITRSGNMPDGGAFESVYLSVMAADADGSRHLDFFDLEAFDAALACYERARIGSGREAPNAGRKAVANAVRSTHEPTPDRRSIPRNAATRADARLFKTHAAGDWDAVRRLAGDDFRFEDRGKRALVDGDVDTWLKSMQFIRSQPGVRFEHELLATLGERILIGKMDWIGESDEAEFLTDKLRLVEVAADGRLRRLTLFDPDDRATAFVEGLERFAAGEAGGADGATAYAAFARALLGFDWDAVRRHLAPEFVFDDRRPLSLGILNHEQWIASLRVQADMAPNLGSEVTRVLAWNRHGFVGSLRTYGNLRDGGPFENDFLCVFLASGGKLTRVEPHPIDADESAVARFEELCAALDGESRRGPAALPPNSAMKAGTRFFEVLGSAGDDRAAALASPNFRYRDRGRRALLDGDVHTWIRSIRFLTSQARTRFEQLAMIGDRIVVSRLTWTGRPGGPELELDRISLLEVDDTGRLCSVTLFDLEDRPKAMLQGLEDFAAGEAGGGDGPTTYAAWERAFQRRDWDALSECLSPSLRFDDHRPLSLGVLNGNRWLESLRVAVDLAPEFASDVPQVLAWNSRGVLLSLRLYGILRDGGSFENFLLGVFVASGGKMTHVEPFPIDAKDAALARFEELTRDPLDIAPNDASRVGLQTMELFLACNWPAIRELASPGFRYEDRSRRALVTGDVETWITSMQFVREQLPARTEHNLIATFGDRVELREFMFVANPDGAAIEIERLRLGEVDEHGQLVSVVFFDPEDRTAACIEGLRRFAIGEIAETMPLVELFEAGGRRDWDGAREALSADAMFDDHRPLSFGTIDREQWIASLIVQVEMAPDATLEPSHVIAWNRHGLVLLTRIYGNLRDSGPFENVSVVLCMADQQRVVRLEPFLTGDIDKALARFDELCAARDAGRDDRGTQGAPVMTA